MTVAQMLTLAASGDSGYSDEELARVCAADMLAGRDRRRIADEYAAELEAERVEVDEGQWEPYRCPRTDLENNELKNGG